MAAWHSPTRGSREYQEWSDGDWHDQAGAPDLNRIARQQHFLRTAAAAVLAEINSNPFRLGDLIDAAGDVVRLDANVDLLDAGEAMFAAAEEGLHTFVPPVEGLIVGDQSALALADGADEILDYFRGTGPLPAVTESSVAANTTR